MLQKRIIRIITLSKYLDHTGPLFKELGLLNIGDQQVSTWKIYV